MGFYKCKNMGEFFSISMNMTTNQSKIVLEFRTPFMRSKLYPIQKSHTKVGKFTPFLTFLGTYYIFREVSAIEIKISI